MIEKQELNFNELLLHNIGQMSAVYHLTNELINVQDIDNYYKIIIENIPSISGFKNTIVYKLNSYKNEIELVASSYKKIPEEIKYIKINAEIKEPFIAVVTGQSKIFKKEKSYRFDRLFSEYYKSDNFAVVPLKSKKNIIGLIIVSNENDLPVDTEKFDIIKLISNMAAFVYENLLLKTELEIAQNYFYDYIDIISRQFRLLSVLNSANSAKEILKVLTDNVKKSIGIDYVMVFNYIQEVKIFEIIQASENVPDDLIIKKYNDLSLDDLISKSYFKKEIFKFEVKPGDKYSYYGQNVKQIIETLKIEDFVILSLMGKDTLFSVVFFGTVEKKISTQDFDELRMFCNQVGVTLENEMLTEKIKLLNRQMKDDLTTAGHIQQSLLPKDLKDIKDFNIIAENIQTSFIGGDFYVFSKKDNDSFVAIGDVCGHGPSAALVMALLMQIYNDEFKESNCLKEILKNVNNRYCNSVETNIAGFVTSFAVKINIAEKKLNYANAGHNYPYYYENKSKKLFKLENSNFFFGLDSDSEYDVYEKNFDSGDILILYTDGIVEALNDKNEQFGYIRFEEALLKSIHLDIEKIKNNVIMEVKKFVKNREFDDDWTIVILKF